VRRDGYRRWSTAGPRRRSARVRRALAPAVLAASTWAFPCLSDGVGPSQISEGAPVRHIMVTLNKSKTLNFRCRFTTAVIGSPDIADLLPMSDQTLYVQGKKVGTTNISAFDANKHLCAVVDLDVELDAGTLHSNIAATTGARGINVASENGQIVLTGQASDSVTATRAVEVAAGLAGKGAGVINAMTVSPSQQVMLKVRFLEVDRNAGRDFGINWFGGNKNGFGATGLGAAAVNAPPNQLAYPTQAPNAPTATFPGLTTSGVFPGTASSASPFGALLATVVNTHGVQIATLISALEAKGLVKTLAEPDLVAQSGQPANFFAGSQIPIPTVQPGTIGTTPTVTVQYQNCGVTLQFTPTVLNTGLINLNLAPQVCEVATSASPVVVNGTVIPELTTRSANTTVELRDGQSFAVAGLLQAQDVDQLSQLPWAGNVPVLGALFRSTNYQKAETDLVVIVTVHLVRPAAPGTKLATPFDTALTSNDIDLFLMGDPERKKKYTQFITSGGDLKGPYGHILEDK
jgi:pilus assembly protein CpaC